MDPLVKLPESAAVVDVGTTFSYQTNNPENPSFPLRYHFVVTKVLSRSGQGVAVCLATNPLLLGENNLTIIKIVFPDKFPPSTAKDIALREQEINMVLTDNRKTFHPFVAKNYGTVHFAANVYAMQNKWYPSGDYNQALLQNDLIGRRRFVPEEEFKTYMKSALQALAFVHSRNVTHRDIKPQNILVDGCFSVLMDFGHSKITATGKNVTFVGTDSYQAPEQRRATGDGTITPFTNACDIWSLGVTFYRMLFGGHPEDLDSNFRQHSKLKFPSAPTIDLQLANILNLMTDFEPSKRPSALQLLNKNYFQAIQYPAQIAPNLPI